MSVVYDSYTITDLTDENIFIVYSEYPNGKNGDTDSFSTEPNKYVGIYTGTATSAPTDASLYTWSQLVGDTGNGISSITEHYQVSSSNSIAPTSWVDDANVQMTSTNRYLWNYETIIYTNGTTKDTTKRVIGVYGDTGATGTGYTILLSNESHTFPGSTSAATASSASTNIIAYKNTSQVSTTITNIGSTSVSGNASSIATGVTGLTASVTNNGTTTCTITFSATTSLTTKSGTIAITITVDGQTFTKYFSFSLSLTGAAGETGAAAKSVDITASSQIFKSTDGGLTFSPDTIKLTPVFQGGISYSKWQYSIDGGVTWTDVISGSNGLTISSSVLSIAKSSDLYTDTVTTVSFKCIGSDSTYYDIVTVVKLYDVTDLEIGGTQLLIDTNLGTFTKLAGPDDRYLSDSSVGITGEFFELTDAPVSGLKYGYRYTMDGSGAGKKTSRSLTFYKGTTGTVLQNGETYTLSGYYRISGADSVHMRGQYGSSPYKGNYDIVLNSETWTRLSWTFVADSTCFASNGTCRIYTISPSNEVACTVESCGFKLEKGNVATDWSPALEDIATVKVLDTEISRVEMKADQANESISLKVWKNDLYITGYDENGNSIGKNLEQIMSEIFIDTEGILSRVGHNEAAIGATDDAPDEGGSIFARLTELKQSADEIYIRVVNEDNESSISITDKAINAIANTINMNDTQLLSGGALINHSIKTDALATDAIMSINYVVDNDNNVLDGSFLNLENGSFKSRYLYWNEYGVINAQAGYIGGCQIIDGKLQIPGGNITKTSISSDQLDIENIFSNSAIIEKIISNELFSNAISTNGILSATSDKTNDVAKRLDELTAQFLELKQNCSVNITEDIYQYHGSGVPTLETYPTIDFFESSTCSESVTVLDTLLVSTSKYADHIGDIYKNDDNGSYFQFRQDGDGNYGWILMTQEEIFAISPGVAGIIVGGDSVGIIASNLGVTGSMSIEKDVIGFSFDDSSVCTIKSDGVRASAIYCC